MKTTIFTPGVAMSLIIIMVMMNSCKKEDQTTTGFDVIFGSNSRGLTTTSLHTGASALEMGGEIMVDEGDIKVELMNPDGYIVYQKTFYAPGSYTVRETFKPDAGEWMLRYASRKGTGKITLRLIFKE